MDAINNLLGREHWSRTNPVDIPFDADGKAYSEVLKLLLKDKNSNGILVMHVPWKSQPDEEVAEALRDSLKRVKRMVLTAWLGSGAADRSREVFRRADIPTYDTPTHAVRAFLYMAEYLQNQEMLIETPDSLPTDFFPDTSGARDIVRKALDEGRDRLTEPEAKGILAAYGIPVVETRIAVSAKEAVIAADKLGYPVALKLRSPQIPQPFDVGGVLLDLETPERVWEGAASILARCTRERPDAYIEGFTVQKMGRRPGAHELFVTAKVDPVFGPVLAFGHGGMARMMIQDEALTLPPLSMSLAREMVERTRIHTLLKGTPSHPAADIDDICLTLIQISQLIVDVPQVTSIDINPLYADGEGVLALGGKVTVATVRGRGREPAGHPALPPRAGGVRVPQVRPPRDAQAHPARGRGHPPRLPGLAHGRGPAPAVLRRGPARVRPTRTSPGSPRSTTTGRWPSSPRPRTRRASPRPWASCAPTPSRTTPRRSSPSWSART